MNQQFLIVDIVDNILDNTGTRQTAKGPYTAISIQVTSQLNGRIQPMPTSVTVALVKPTEAVVVALQLPDNAEKGSQMSVPFPTPLRQ